MRWQNRAIVELADLELIQAHTTLVAQEQRRNVVAQHEKFTIDRVDPATGKQVQKMEFPSINPHFVQVKMEIENELKKRNIKLGNDNE